MNQRRLVELQLARALAEGLPAGEALRSIQTLAVAGAASEMDAGRLAAGLRRAGIDRELADLAAQWPKALEPAQRRLLALPSRLNFAFSLAEVVAYFMGVHFFLFLGATLLKLKVLPTLASTARQYGQIISKYQELAGWVQDGIYFVSPSFMLVGMLLIVIGIWPFSWLPGWGRHYIRAREAAIAAALAESGAPVEVWQVVTPHFRVLSPEAASAAELDRTGSCAVAAALASHQRLVSAARWVATALLMAIAVLLTLSVYGMISEIGALP